MHLLASRQTNTGPGHAMTLMKKELLPHAHMTAALCSHMGHVQYHSHFIQTLSATNGTISRLCIKKLWAALINPSCATVAVSAFNLAGPYQGFCLPLHAFMSLLRRVNLIRLASQLRGGCLSLPGPQVPNIQPCSFIACCILGARQQRISKN